MELQIQEPRLLYPDIFAFREYGAQVSLQISSLLFADDFVLLVSSNQDLQHALGQFAAECEATSKSEKVPCSLQIDGEQLPQVAEFKYLGVLFKSEGWMEHDSAELQSLYWTVVVRNELILKIKLLIYQ